MHIRNTALAWNMTQKNKIIGSVEMFNTADGLGFIFNFFCGKKLILSLKSVK